MPKGGQLVVYKPRPLSKFVRRRSYKINRGAVRRAQNISKMTMWFKRVQAMTSDTNGNIGFSVLGGNVDTVDDFVTFGTLYSQFQVRKIVCKFYPANVGGESQQTVAGGFAQFQRGDCASYTGKRAITGLNNIVGTINRGSARLMQPRRLHKRWMTRPKTGYDEWGELNNTGGVDTVDPWDLESGIHLVGENFTPTQAPGSQNFFYVITYWKVVFRSRQE